MRADRSATGFTLVELMLAAALGVLFCGVVSQLLLGELRQGGSLAQSLLMKGVQRRTLALVKQDLNQAVAWQIDPSPSADWPCPLAGRRPLLAIQPRNGSNPVVYSLGTAPSAIWQGQVLMRCGPAFDLNGRSSGGSYQNRVVLDAVDSFGISQPDVLPLLKLDLNQRLPGKDRWVRSSGVG
jgi:type II secretory pathway pseudopilin PulG